MIALSHGMLTRLSAHPLLRWFFYPPTTPAGPIALYGPLVAAVVGWNLAGGTSGIGTAMLLLFGGVLFWTLLEYVLHGVAFHVPFAAAPFRAVRALHGEHHEAPADPRFIFTRPVFSLPPALLFWGLFRLVLPSWAEAALPAAGVALGYVWYEVAHYLIHTRPRMALVRGLARHHLHHHYKDPTRCFGVSTRLWDLVFRTGRRAGRRVGVGSERLPV